MPNKHVRKTHGRCAAGIGSLTGLALLGFGLYGSADASEPNPPAGWHRVWSDDFSGPAGTLPSNSDWIIDSGTNYPGGPSNWGTGEVETYTWNTGNLQQDGQGNLVITPIRLWDGRWTSARMETRRSDFQPPVGGKLRIEARIQLPDVTGEAAQGYWPAFWALGASVRDNPRNWPRGGEFDVMENVNGLNKVFGTLHCGTDPGGPCNETSGNGAGRACPNTTCAGHFHTYSFEWDRSSSPQQLRWYVDGELYHIVNSGQMDAATWNAATDHGDFILLNLAMGGSFPNQLSSGAATPTSATVSGAPMKVDYVSVSSTTG